MSKTIRRTRGKHAISGWGSGDESFINYATYWGEGVYTPEASLRIVLSMYHTDSWKKFHRSHLNQWCRGLIETGPERARVRDLLRLTMKLEDLEDTPLFPKYREIQKSDMGDWYW
ncbi:hypothetical protein D3C71_79700 [compost metagenome]